MELHVINAIRQTFARAGWFLLIAMMLLAGCDARSADQAAASAAATSGKPAVDAPYRITATVGMIADIVRQVAGERAEVVGLMKQGVDPHLYKPTRSDIAKLMNADVVFYNGLMLEGKMTDVLVKVSRQGKPVYPVTEMLEESYVMATPADHYDPHVWMDVRGWMSAVRTTEKLLSEYDPVGAEMYQQNAESYLKQLEQLDQYARDAIASIPKSQRVLVTAHDAFGYFGRAYEIEVRGIQGVSTESEAGVKDINDLVDFLVERKIGAVFVETSVADKNVRALIEGAASRDHTVIVGGTLFSDAMGPDGSYEGTYIGMIDHNVTAVARALDGQAPPRGMQGKLTVSP